MKKLRLREEKSLSRVSLLVTGTFEACMSDSTTAVFPTLLSDLRSQGSRSQLSPPLGSLEVRSSPRQPDKPLVAFPLLVFLALSHLSCLRGGTKAPRQFHFY